MTIIFMILLSKSIAAKDAGSAAGKPCGDLEARLNFAWISVQDSGTREQMSQESAPLFRQFPLALPARQPASFGDHHRAMNGLPAMAISGDGWR
jgi:hypothetical protein